MTNQRTRWFYRSMFASLYFVQGAALAYFRNFQKPYLDGLNIDVDVIGLLTSILLLPFILKIFIGMLSDSVSLFRLGYRKPYIIVGLLLAAAAFATAGFILPDKRFMLFAALIVLGSFSVTIFDSTADGLAIDITPKDQRGTIQGTMVGGRALGFILLSLLFGVLVQSQGYRIVFLIIAFSMLIPLIWVVKTREPEARIEDQRFQWRAFKAMGKPRFLLFAAFAVFYSIVSFGVDGLVTFFMSEVFNASAATLGQYGALRGIGAVVGALAGGLLVDRMGRKWSAYGAALLISIVTAIIGAASGISTLLALGIFWGIAWGFQETVFVALAMDLAEIRIAASMFAIMMAFSNLGTAIGEGMATGLTDNMSFSNIFWLLAGINIITILSLWGLFKIAPDLNIRVKAKKVALEITA